MSDEVSRAVLLVKNFSSTVSSLHEHCTLDDEMNTVGNSCFD